MSGIKILKSRFVRNAVILTATSLLLRTVGIFFRVYLAGKLGAEGMGLYQLIISIYVLGSTFASAGISTAVTRLVTDELVCGTRKSVLKILRRSIQLSVMVGVFSAGVIFFSADFISGVWLGDIRASLALKVLTVGLPFMGAGSCLRGYFMARRKAGHQSRAQLLEQTVRIAVLLLVLDRFIGKGLAAACMAVMIADTLAEMGSCGLLAAGYFWDKRKLKARNGTPKEQKVVSRLLTIAVPITAGRYLTTALRTVENILVPGCLAKFYLSKETGLAQFGMLKGMAMPLLFFPASFLSALSTLLVPEISEAAALGNKKRVNTAVCRTLHLTLSAAVLIAGVFFLYAKQLGMVFYGSAEVGFLLTVLAPLMPLMYMESLIDGILKGLNQQVSSLKYNVADSVVRIGLILLVVPYRGMEGFLFVMVVSNMLTSLLNLHRLLTVTGIKMQWFRWVLGPVIAIAGSVGLSWLIGRTPAAQSLPHLVLLIAGAAVIVIVYGLLLAVMGCLPKFRRQRADDSGQEAVYTDTALEEVLG